MVYLIYAIWGYRSEVIRNLMYCINMYEDINQTANRDTRFSLPIAKMTVTYWAPIVFGLLECLSDQMTNAHSYRYKLVALLNCEFNFHPDWVCIIHRDVELIGSLHVGAGHPSSLTHSMVGTCRLLTAHTSTTGCSIMWRSRQIHYAIMTSLLRPKS